MFLPALKTAWSRRGGGPGAGVSWGRHQQDGIRTDLERRGHTRTPKVNWQVWDGDPGCDAETGHHPVSTIVGAVACWPALGGGDGTKTPRAGNGWTEAGSQMSQRL